MTASESTTAPAAPEVFKQLALSIQDYLNVQTIDEPAVRDIVDAAVAAARLPRPIEVHLPGGQVNVLTDRTHRQFDELMGLVTEGQAHTA